MATCSWSSVSASPVPATRGFIVTPLHLGNGARLASIYKAKTTTHTSMASRIRLESSSYLGRHARRQMPAPTTTSTLHCQKMQGEPGSRPTDNRLHSRSSLSRLVSRSTQLHRGAKSSIRRRNVRNRREDYMLSCLITPLGPLVITITFAVQMESSQKPPSALLGFQHHHISLTVGRS
jgi:hypothetical protein